VIEVLIGADRPRVAMTGATAAVAVAEMTVVAGDATIAVETVVVAEMTVVVGDATIAVVGEADTTVAAGDRTTVGAAHTATVPSGTSGPRKVIAAAAVG